MSKQDHEDLKSRFGHCMHCKKTVQVPCGSGALATTCLNFLQRCQGLPPMQEQKSTGISLTGDAINQPAHYARWKMQPIEFIAANDFPFWLANVIKYCCRYDVKDGLQDLYKARSYLDMQIRKLEGEGRFWEKPVSEQQRLKAK